MHAYISILRVGRLLVVVIFVAVVVVVVVAVVRGLLLCVLNCVVCLASHNGRVSKYEQNGSNCPKTNN